MKRLVEPRIASGYRLGPPNEMMHVIDDSDRAWDASLSRDESLPLQPLDHLVHGGSRHEEVPCDIGFSWGDTVAEDVPCNELEVVQLTPGGLRAVLAMAGIRVAPGGSQGGCQVAMKQRDGEDRVVGEVNVET